MSSPSETEDKKEDKKHHCTEKFILNRKEFDGLVLMYYTTQIVIIISMM